MSCGRGAWVSTMRGAHKKSARAACPWRWGQGQRPAPGTPIVAGPGFILGSHNHARRPCPSQSSSSTVRQTPSFDGGNVGATAGIGGNPACDYPGAVEIATRWAEYNGCVGELKLGDKPKYDLNTAVDGKETTVNKFQQCPNGIDVELWTLEGVPHPPRFYEVFGANGIKTLAQKSWEFLQPARRARPRSRAPATGCAVLARPRRRSHATPGQTRRTGPRA
jgi:poly(3-hydroxybutyrate) depolymerase